jgi:hypothetical protein
MVSILAYQRGLKPLRGRGVLRIAVEKAASASGIAKITVSSRGDQIKKLWWAE